MKDINLMDRVKDRVTGYEGRVLALAHILNQDKQCLVAPTTLADNGELRKSFWLDQQRLELLEESSENYDYDRARFNLGDKVRDSITGFVGVIREVVLYHTGCYRYTVQGSKLDTEKGTPVEPVALEEDRLELVAQPNPPQHAGIHPTSSPPRGGPPAYAPTDLGAKGVR